MTFLNMLLLMDVLLEKRKENNKKEVLSCSCAHQSRQMRLIWQRAPSFFQWALRHRDSGGNNTEICPIPRLGPGSANTGCTYFLRLLAEKIIFINWWSGSSGSVTSPHQFTNKTSWGHQQRETERDGDQARAPLCLRPGLAWVSHKTKLNEKIEGFAELDKWSPELALRFSMFYKYFPAWNIF